MGGLGAWNGSDQFTYFQQAGGFELDPISVELTYGLERLAMDLQDVHSVYDLEWTKGVSYGDVQHQAEVEFSKYNFETSDAAELNGLFDAFERECRRALSAQLALPAYDYVLKCSHVFNLLDARGAESVIERQRSIGRVRALAHQCAKVYLATREALGFPLRKGIVLWSVS